jgi:hypothetical protein
MTHALPTPDSDELSSIRARIRGKSCALVEVGLDRLFPYLNDPETSAGTVLAIMRDLTKLGDLEPKKEAPVAAPGAGFSISINLPGPDGRRTLTLEASRQQVDELGDVPAHVSFDYHANDDLTGGVDAGEDVLLLPRDEDS